MGGLAVPAPPFYSKRLENDTRAATQLYCCCLLSRMAFSKPGKRPSISASRSEFI